MKTLTLDVRTPADSIEDFTHGWKTGKPQKSARISFATLELLWQALTAKRWELLKTLCGAGPGVHPRGGSMRQSWGQGRPWRCNCPT